MERRDPNRRSTVGSGTLCLHDRSQCVLGEQIGDTQRSLPIRRERWRGYAKNERLCGTGGDALWGCSLNSIENLLGTNPPTLTVVVSPKTQTLVVSAQQQFAATVKGTSSQNVEWSIAGTACTPTTDCGTITASGLFTAPASVPNPPEITITAKAKANTKDSGAAVVTVMSAPATSAALRGSYAFLVNGADAEGPLSMGGSFVADGAGHLHSGELRVCRDEAQCTDQIFCGTTSANTKDTGSFELDVFPRTTFSYAAAGANGVLKLEISGTRRMRAKGIMNANAE
jgi:hypothetical protein